MTGKEIGIYINNELVATTGKGLEYPGPATEIVHGIEHEITFQGLALLDDRQPDELELEYTTRRNGTVYFRCINHPYIKRFSAKADHAVYEQFKGIKRGTKITGTINYNEE